MRPDAEPPSDFHWRDGPRTVVFRRGGWEQALDILSQAGWDSYELVATARALGHAPAALSESAARVHVVGPGRVDELSAGLLPGLAGERLVALGGGRAIDVAKALGSAVHVDVAAVPTTLSGAPMTGFHRLPAGVPGVPLTRPLLVIADPEAMTGLPGAELRATAMNALAHAAESLYVPLANPVSRLAALEGAGLLAVGLDGGGSGPDDRARLALGALLCAYAVDATMFAMHHALCQTLVRELGIPHAETNATMLPHTMGAMRPRAPRQMEDLAEALGTTPEGLPDRIAELGGGPRRLSELGAGREGIPRAVGATLAHPLLAATPDPPAEAELLALVEAAW